MTTAAPLRQSCRHGGCPGTRYSAGIIVWSIVDMSAFQGWSYVIPRSPELSSHCAGRTGPGPRL